MKTHSSGIRDAEFVLHRQKLTTSLFLFASPLTQGSDFSAQKPVNTCTVRFSNYYSKLHFLQFYLFFKELFLAQ